MVQGPTFALGVPSPHSPIWALGRMEVRTMNERSPAGLDAAIMAYYDRAPEETRLDTGPFQLEALRTRELIQRHAPPPPVTVLDIGGAAGAYAAWLAEAGYTVHLVDPVARLVAEARRRSATLTRPITSCEVGDARALAFPA